MQGESILSFYYSMDVDILIRVKLRKNTNIPKLARKISLKIGTSVFIVYDGYMYIKPIMFVNKEGNPLRVIPIIQMMYKGYKFEPVVVVKNKNILGVLEPFREIYDIVDEEEIYKNGEVFVMYAN